MRSFFMFNQTFLTMRKMIVFVLMLVTVGYAMSFAGLPSEDNLVVVQRGDVFKVLYSGQSDAPVKVAILDNRGTEVFSEKLDASNGFIRPYNLSQLPRGDYKICVLDESGEQAEKICTRVKEWPARISRMNDTEDKFMLTIPHQANTEVSISIYDKDNTLLYSANENITGGYAKVYVLKNLTEGATIKLVNQATGEEKYLVTE
jgi:hypothetical protein